MTPGLTLARLTDRDGKRLESFYSPVLGWEFVGQTFLDLEYKSERVRLRPEEARVAADRDFKRHIIGGAFRTSFVPEIEFEGRHFRGNDVNHSPATGQEASMQNWSSTDITLTVRPLMQLNISNRYLFTKLADRETDATIFNDHIIRSRWNWQFTRELSSPVHPAIRIRSRESRIHKPRKTKEHQHRRPLLLPAERLDGTLRGLQRQPAEYRSDSNLDGVRGSSGQRTDSSTTAANSSRSFRIWSGSERPKGPWTAIRPLHPPIAVLALFGARSVMMRSIIHTRRLSHEQSRSFAFDHPVCNLSDRSLSERASAWVDGRNDHVCGAGAGRPVCVPGRRGTTRDRSSASGALPGSSCSDAIAGLAYRNGDLAAH